MKLLTVTQGNDTVGNCDETNRNSWSQKIEMTSRETLTARIEKWNGNKISQSEMEIKLQKLKWIDQKLSQAEMEMKLHTMKWNAWLNSHSQKLEVNPSENSHTQKVKWNGKKISESCRNWKWITQKTLTPRKWNGKKISQSEMEIKPQKLKWIDQKRSHSKKRKWTFHRSKDPLAAPKHHGSEGRIGPAANSPERQKTSCKPSICLPSCAPTS